MNTSRCLPALAVVAFVILMGLPPPAQAQSAPSRPASAAQATSDALAACERAARQSLTAGTGASVADLKFSGAPSEPPGSDPQLVLRGSASWRSNSGPRRFDFICNVDLRTPEAVGLVIRDTTPAAPEATTARAVVEPDLSNVSPAACESSAAAALKKRWPLVNEISFDTSTRTLSQESATQGELRGQGRALPAPGAPVTHFSFDCQFDPRNGRVVATRISG
jgi:hypothetical protein